jgi:hypothetical protein
MKIAKAFYRRFTMYIIYIPRGMDKEFPPPVITVCYPDTQQNEKIME